MRKENVMEISLGEIRKSITQRYAMVPEFDKAARDRLEKALVLHAQGSTGDYYDIEVARYGDEFHAARTNEFADATNKEIIRKYNDSSSCYYLHIPDGYGVFSEWILGTRMFCAISTGGNPITTRIAFHFMSGAEWYNLTIKKGEFCLWSLEP